MFFFGGASVGEPIPEPEAPTVAEVPGGSSRRDKKKRKGPRPRYRWEDDPKQVFPVVPPEVIAPDPIPIELEDESEEDDELILAALRVLH